MRSKLIINSSIAFILAAMLEMTLHEAGHFFASIAMGGQAILHHNYVSHEDVSANARILSASAGPLVSLVIGVVFQMLLHTRRYRGMTALVLLYMSIFGYIGFFGYLFIAPFFAYGDAGFVLRAIGCPPWGIIGLSVAAIGILFVLGRAWSVHVIGLMSSRTAADKQQRRQFIYSVVFFPLFIGIAVTTLLNLPVPTELSLIAPLTSPFVILWPFGYYLRRTGIYHDEEERLGQKIHYGWVVVMWVVVGVSRLLVAGWEW